MNAIAPSHAKSRLRTVLAERRQSLSRDAATLAGAAIARRLVGEPALRPAVAVAGFWPLAGELDPRPIMTALADRGHPLALPRMAGFGEALEFRSYAAGERLVEGRFRVMEPAADRPLVRPGVVLVPLLGFDRRGHRLGYGAGFYDRTLAALRAEDDDVVAVGVAFALQEVDEVPIDDRDQPLDLVATEREIIRVGGGRSA